MNREDFDNLEIIDQVNYINSEIINLSLNKIANNMGMSESTIRDRFKRNGYKRNGKEYTKVYESKPGDNKPHQDKPGKPQETIKKAATPKKKDNNINTQEAKIKVLEGQIKSLEEHINNIYKLLENKEYTNVNKSILTNIHKDIEQLQGTKTITRSYKLYEEVDKRLQERIQQHIDNNKQYKKQDIINSIILNYLDSIE